MTKLVKYYKIINVIFSNYSVFDGCDIYNITREKLYNKISYGGFYNAEIYITKRFISRKGST